TKTELEKVKAGGGSSELEAQVKALEEKNAELEAAVKSSAAIASDDPMGAMGGDVAVAGDEALKTAREEMEAAQNEAKQARVELATATKALERKDAEIERLNGKIAEASGGEV